MEFKYCSLPFYSVIPLNSAKTQIIKLMKTNSTKRILVLNIILISLFFVTFTGHPLLANKNQSISVIVGDCYAGNHAGSFDAEYKGHKVSVDLVWGETKLYINNKEVQDVSSNFSPYSSSAGKSPVSGKTVKVNVIWKGNNNFKAYNVYIK